MSKAATRGMAAARHTLTAWGLGSVLAAMMMSSAYGAGPQSVADVAEKLSPAVVNISTTQKIDSPTAPVPMPELPENSPFKQFFDEFFDKQHREGGQVPQKVSSLGSGFVIDSTGIIVTNNHVIEGAEQIEVNFPDGRTMQAKLIGKDTKTDLALLKVESSEPLPHVSFGDSDKLRVGDWVMAIGNPFGLGGSVTLGIVSARNRDINAGPYDDFIQTDAAINRGNSGGPLFDMDGTVVGINTAIISPSGGSIGIGFSVPANTAKGVVDQLRQFGETRRGWLGVKIQSVTPEIAEGLSLGKVEGALVSDVTPTGPAEKAGVKSGDVITQFNGAPIREMRDLPRIVADTAVGKTVDIVVLRMGQTKSLAVTLGRLEEGEKLVASAEPAPQSAPSGPSVDVLGMKLAALSDDLRRQYNIGSQVDGVVVVSVEPSSAAAEKRIEPGDVITEADLHKAHTPKEVADRAKSVADSGKTSILLVISKSAQQGELRFIPLKLKNG